MSDTYRSLSIIIPSHNGENLFPLFMPSILEAIEQYPGKSELIVVDDKSTDNSVNMLKQMSEVTLIEHETNLGFQKACNTGFNAAQYDILFFLNNDVQLEPDIFDYFNLHFDKDDTFAITIHGINYDTNTRMDGGKVGFWHKGMPRFTHNYYVEDHPEMKQPYLSFAVQGAYFFVDKAKMMQLDGFDELLAPFLFEETDLSYRALKRGWKIYYEPQCSALHKHKSTVSNLASEKKRRMLSYRNQMIFIWKNIDDPLLLASHIFFLLIRVVFTPGSTFWQAFWDAFKKRPAIMEKRKIEQKAAQVSDRELFTFFKTYYKQNGIR